MRRIWLVTAALLVGVSAPAFSQLGDVNMGADYRQTVRRLARSAVDTFAVDERDYGACRGFLLSDRRLAVCGVLTSAGGEREVAWIRVSASSEDFRPRLIGNIARTYNHLFGSYYGEPEVQNESFTEEGPATWRWETSALRARVRLYRREQTPHQVEVTLARR